MRPLARRVACCSRKAASIAPFSFLRTGPVESRKRPTSVPNAAADRPINRVVNEHLRQLEHIVVDFENILKKEGRRRAVVRLDTIVQSLESVRVICLPLELTYEHLLSRYNC